MWVFVWGGGQMKDDVSRVIQMAEAALFHEERVIGFSVVLDPPPLGAAPDAGTAFVKKVIARKRLSAWEYAAARLKQDANCAEATVLCVWGEDCNSVFSFPSVLHAHFYIREGHLHCQLVCGRLRVKDIRDIAEGWGYLHGKMYAELLDAHPRLKLGVLGVVAHELTR